MRDLRKMFGTGLLTLSIAVSAITPILADNTYYQMSLKNITLTSSTDVKSTAVTVPAGTFCTVPKFSSVTKTGTYYIGFDYKRGDGTYGGGTRQVATANKYTMNRLYTFELSGTRSWKECIVGNTGAGTISEVTLFMKG